MNDEREPPSFAPYRQQALPPAEDENARRARDALATHLAPREHLVWTDRPARGVRLSERDIVLIPFSLMWGGFAVFWEWGVATHGAPSFFLLWGVPFVLIGQYLIWGRFVVAARRRARTFYGLTESRALILVDGLRRDLQSLDLSSPCDIRLHEGRGGRGTLRFSRAGDQNGRQPPPSFEHIPHVRDVYQRVMALRQALLGSRGPSPRESLLAKENDDA